MVNKVMVVDDVDRQVWELITNVPRLSKEWAALCALINVILPGMGTMLCACKGGETVSKAQLLIGAT